MHEVYRILNTRRGARQAFYTEIEDDAVYFGLPALFGFNDFQSFDALNTSDKRKIITICEKSITMFEPRLKEVNVKIESYNSQTQSLEISISGFIKLEQRLEQIQFPMSIDRQNY
jgi:type VI secretion system lysozyme-like protein